MRRLWMNYKVWEAIVNSSRSYEEILGMIKGELSDVD